MSSQPLRLALYAAAIVAFVVVLGVRPTTKGMTPEESRQLLEQGKERYRQGDYAGAIEATSRLHEAYPDNPIYMRQLAESYRSLGSTTEEAAFWELYLTYAPTPREACSPLIKAYQELRDNDKTVDAATRCLELDPTGSGVHFLLAYAHERAGNEEDAEAVYRRGLEFAPGHSDMQLGLARILLRTKRAEAAGEMALAILADRPDHTDALLVAGQSLRSAGNLEGAKIYLERGIALSSSYTDFYRILGGIAEQQDDFMAASRHYEEVLRQAPGDASIARRLERLRTDVGQ